MKYMERKKCLPIFFYPYYGPFKPERITNAAQIANMVRQAYGTKVLRQDHLFAGAGARQQLQDHIQCDRKPPDLCQAG